MDDISFLITFITLHHALVIITPMDPVEMNHFQIFGPRSHAVLDAVLQLCSQENEEQVEETKDMGVDENNRDEGVGQHDYWKRILKTCSSPSCISPGSVFDLFVQDPRVK